MRRWVYIVCSILLGALLSACNITRNIPDNEYLLQRVKIVEDKSAPRDQRVSSEVLSNYIRQKPNKRFLGFDFYVWVYQLDTVNKSEGWKKFKDRVGQKPVYYSKAETERSVGNIKAYLDLLGYYSSEASFSLETNKKKKRAKVTYTFKQGNPYRIDSITYEFQDKTLEPIVMSDTINSLIHTGDIFNALVLDKERERISKFLLDRGYYRFSPKNISYDADTLGGNNKANINVVIKKDVINYTQRGVPIITDNSIFRIRNISIKAKDNAEIAALSSNKKLQFDSIEYRGLNIHFKGKKPQIRPEVLRSTITLYPNYLYNQSQANQTYSNLMSTGYFTSPRIKFDTIPNSGYNLVSLLRADSTYASKIDYIQERYLDCNIEYTPALQHGLKAELEAATTSSFFGLTAVLGYQNRNIFRGAEMLEITGTAGYEYMRARNSKKRHAMEFGIAAGLSVPRFLLANYAISNRTLAPKTKFELSYNFQDRPYYQRHLSSASWTYMWRNQNNSSFIVRPISVNWVDVSYIDENYYNSLQNQYLKYSFESQLIVALSGSYIYKKQYKSAPNNQTTVRANCEFSGNLLNGLVRLFSSKPAPDKNYYELFGIRYAQYVRADINASHDIKFGKVTTLAARLYAGVAYAYGNSSAVPFDRLFYAGGSNSMRGWAPRTLGPGSSAAPTNVVYPTQLGDMKLEANLEFRFPIWYMLQGATFLDLGNIWYIQHKGEIYPEGSTFHFNSFYKQLAFNTGIGLRLDIDFAVLRLDWGIQLHNPNNPYGQRWIHNFKWRNTSLNFGVGFPF